MNKYYKKFFLFNLIFFSVFITQFANCESYNAALETGLGKDEKAIYRNQFSQDKPSWKQFLFTPVGFGILTFALFAGTNLINEWMEGRKLSFVERELVMINLQLTYLVAFAFCNSSKNKDVKDEPKVQLESICISQV